jgi:hypothetical protein
VAPHPKVVAEPHPANGAKRAKASRAARSCSSSPETSYCTIPVTPNRERRRTVTDVVFIMSSETEINRSSSSQCGATPKSSRHRRRRCPNTALGDGNRWPTSPRRKNVGETNLSRIESTGRAESAMTSQGRWSSNTGGDKRTNRSDPKRQLTSISSMASRNPGTASSSMTPICSLLTDPSCATGRNVNDLRGA